MTARRKPKPHPWSQVLPLLSLLAVGGWACTRHCGAKSPAPGGGASTPRLESLPYLTSVPVEAADRGRMGVVKHEPGAAFPGLTVYCSERSDRVVFLDMEGNVVHEVGAPDARCLMLKAYDRDDFLLIGHGRLLRLDWNSKVRWRREGSYHHDVDVGPRGKILTLTADPRAVAIGGREVEILDNQIAVLDSRGDHQRVLSLFDLLAPEIDHPRLEEVLQFYEERPAARADWNNPTDVIHANALTRLRHVSGFGRPGQVLISARHLDRLLVVDLDSAKVVWTWGQGALDGPHHPSLVGKNLLTFDNGRLRGWSRLIEVDHAGNTVWQYQREAPLFFSPTRGAAQRLPNGNHLITESDKGLVFEIDRDGRVVWEFWNPDLTDTGERRTIYRAMRLSRQEVKSPRLRTLVASLFPDDSAKGYEEEEDL